ncbi:unnamed protein product [Rotaria socialis]|uniref:Uncharacterized protein n=1 Tax=Rotaria socialis TaxID=392032 RepID=A0A821AAK9_9BILA|nr:unnamed protein product [Rotaria socialis]CAF3391975.1 unnamed protein product [Rotaria socialis]CAF3462228.1 unnamed protein product [Rotaria socialis]CAF3527969.1 unnamed protein product [Rotaria socialis]CAF3588976.1 unnamed protein product [Rotaria socialis]
MQKTANVWHYFFTHSILNASKATLFSTSMTRFNDTQWFVWRYSSHDENASALIGVVILIPIIFALIICICLCCIYRYRQQQLPRNTTDLPIELSDQRKIAVSTIFYNSNYDPIAFEELPPAYYEISKAKTEPLLATGNIIPSKSSN